MVQLLFIGTFYRYLLQYRMDTITLYFMYCTFYGFTFSNGHTVIDDDDVNEVTENKSAKRHHNIPYY